MRVANPSLGDKYCICVRICNSMTTGKSVSAIDNTGSTTAAMREGIYLISCTYIDILGGFAW